MEFFEDKIEATVIFHVGNTDFFLISKKKHKFFSSEITHAATSSQAQARESIGVHEPRRATKLSNPTNKNSRGERAKRRTESRDGDGVDGRLEALGADGGWTRGCHGEDEGRRRWSGEVLQPAHPRLTPRGPAEDQ